MPGKVLIIDPVATNRIVMKVKLAEACYQVTQAANGSEGLSAARSLRPDLILCAARLPDMDAVGFAKALRATTQTGTIPLVVETVRRDPEHRLTLLKAGADDILLKPHDDHLLMAQLRNLLRMRETQDDLNLREGASRALGLSEEPQSYVMPGRIAIVAPQAEDALKWGRKLTAHVQGTLETFAQRDAIRRMIGKGAPDAVMMILTPQTIESGLQLLADIRAKPETRDCGVLVLIAGESSQRTAADALDRGANDALCDGATIREIALRLDRLISRKRTLERLRTDMRDGLRAALTDPLTGLFNRRYAMPRFAAICDAAAQSDGPDEFAAMVIDVDHFKLINDQFGHAAGDTVLIHLAEVLKHAVSDTDLLARIGGEEFLIVMPDTGREIAQMAAKRLCEVIRETPFNLPGRSRPLQVTVSIGVALGSDTGVLVDPSQPRHEAVLDCADKALYDAKAHGRNQVTLSAERSAA